MQYRTSSPISRRGGKAAKSLGIAALGAAIATSALSLTPVFTARAASLPMPAPARAALAYSHRPAVVAGLAPLGETDASQLINISFALKPRNADQIPSLLAGLADPKSPEYGRYLSQAEYRSRFGPTQSQVQAVIAYAKASGLIVTHVSPSGLYVRASGTTARINAAFGVKLLDYVSPDPLDSGRVFHTPDREPTVAASIAPLLTSVIGLSDAAVPRSFAHPRTFNPVAAPAFASSFAAPAQSQPTPYGTGHDYTISPADVASIYGLGTSLKTYSGQNQVLGLLEIGGYNASDITTWESYYPLTKTFPALDAISVDNAGTGVNEDTEAEVVLDIDMLLNLAYNAKQIRVYEQGDYDSFADTFDAMANDPTPPSVISVSYGESELDESKSDAQAEANSLQQLALQGQTVCVASGDAGAYTDQSYSTPNVSDPGSQPSVVSVGGTDLADNYTNSTTPATFASETSWYDSSDGNYGNDGTGGGGGVSTFWSVPSWQVGAFSTSTNPQGSTSMRNLPDVSLYASFDTNGYDIYIADDNGWVGYNGTSASSPLWAAMLADVNQERIAAGKPALGLATPQIYALAKSSAYAKDFYDVNDGSTNSYYKAVTGYDNSTGWGSPLNGSQMITDLSGEAAVADFTLSVSPASASAGATVTGTVTLPQPANVAETFALSSSNSTALNVPSSVTIAAGATSATFKATAGTVSSNASVTVTATLDGYSASQSVTVNGSGTAASSLKSVVLSPTSTQGGAAATTANRVYWTSNAPANEVVTLKSSNTAVATVPSSVTISSGSSSHAFTITTKAVTSTQTVTITATSGGVTQTATLTVTAPSGLKSVALSPTSTEGGSAATTANRVYWNGNAPANETVTLTSSNTAVATVPSSVTISSGSSSHAFTITTKAVTSQQTVTIMATSGGVSQTATLTVTP